MTEISDAIWRHYKRVYYFILDPDMIQKSSCICNPYSCRAVSVYLGVQGICIHELDSSRIMKCLLKLPWFFYMWKLNDIPWVYISVHRNYGIEYFCIFEKQLMYIGTWTNFKFIFLEREALCLDSNCTELYCPIKICNESRCPNFSAASGYGLALNRQQIISLFLNQWEPIYIVVIIGWGIGLSLASTKPLPKTTTTCDLLSPVSLE